MTTATPTLDNRMSLKSVFWPIFIEQLLVMSLMMVDIIMLTQYADEAVAAVGLTGQILLFLVLMFMIVSTGSGILIGQNLGANRSDIAHQYAHAGVALAVLFAGLIGISFYFGIAPAIHMYGLAPRVEAYAIDYAVVVGSLSIGLALTLMFSTILRTHGHTRAPMRIQIVGGLINLLGNYVALFGPFGLPIFGVTGVAVATVTSQCVMAILGAYTLRHYGLAIRWRGLVGFSLPQLRHILRLGIPNAGEGISYNLSQLAINFFIASLGTAALTAATLNVTLVRAVFVFALSLGISAQIISSFRVGRGQQTLLKAEINRFWQIGILVSTSLALILYLCGSPLAALFTSDQQVQTLLLQLLLVSILVEAGRAINLVVISALKGAGDVLFPVTVGILSMWGVGVFGAWFLGLHWAWGVAGIWLAVGLDEGTRGIIMIIRWHREKWHHFSQVQ